MSRRVVITGMGVVSPAGNGLREFTQNLKSGKTGESVLTRFSVKDFPVTRAFEIKNFDAHKYRVHLLDPFIQYAVAASHEAFQTASFQPKDRDPYRIGISVSSSKGGVHTMDRYSERLKRNPSALLGARIYANSVPNFAAQWIARRWKIRGPAKCYVAACATGAVAIAHGAELIKEGAVDYCLAGASDASLVPLMLAGYHRMKALAKEGMYPFDARRSGFLVGEGAGIVLLETLESARARKVPIWGEILGYGSATATQNLIRFEPNDPALAEAIQKTLHQSKLDISSIDYINLHGTATREGDLYETQQIKNALGKHAYKIPMSATKSMTGHMLGASGAVEVIATLLAMREGFLPPTANLEKPGEGCDLDYVPCQSRAAKIKNALSLSMGFGGHAVALALRA